MKNLLIAPLVITGFLVFPVMMTGNPVAGEKMTTQFNTYCGKDVETYCKEVKKGEGKIMKCLKKNEDSVSRGCIKFTEKMKKEFKSKAMVFFVTCGGDISRYCSGVKRGEGRIIRCLHKNKDDLSKDCSDLVGEFAVMMK